MVFAFDNPEQIPLSCGEEAGEISLIVKADGKTVFQRDIDYKQPISYRLELKDIDVLSFTADKGKHGPDCDWFILKDIRIN